MVSVTNTKCTDPLLFDLHAVEELLNKSSLDKLERISNMEFKGLNSMIAFYKQSMVIHFSVTADITENMEEGGDLVVSLIASVSFVVFVAY